MSGTISINPIGTSNAAGTFPLTTDGYIQGTAQDAPNARYNLTAGILAATETLPMWGGVALYEDTAGQTTQFAVGGDMGGGLVGRATSVANMTGFSVFDQAYHMLQTPFSPVPCAYVGQSVHMYRFGSGAEIAVQCDPSLATSAIGQLITQQLSWDFNYQRLVPFQAAETGETISSMTYSNGLVTVTTAAAHGLVTGNDVTVQGVTPAGYNGDYTVTVTGTTTFTYPLATNPGTVTVQGTIGAGGGALVGVKLLKINLNSRVVSNPVAVGGNVTWTTGAAALIRL